MELTNGVYGLPLDVSPGGRKMTLSPVVVETPNGLLLPDVGLPDGIDDLTVALDAEGLALADTCGVVITHRDLDHAGCLATVIERANTVVFAHERDTPYLG